MSEQLNTDLRSAAYVSTAWGGLMNEAADRISELQAQLARVQLALKTCQGNCTTHELNETKAEEQLAEKEKLLREIVPLIPDFNFALEHNPAIANYAYLKAAIKGDGS